MVTQVIDQTPRVQFTAAAAQTIFAYPFLIFVKTDITVDVNGTTLVVDVGFTVSDVGNINGGNVTLTAGSTAGDIVTIFRSQGFDRETDYQESGDFLSETVNDDFNRMILMLQQNREELSRTLQYPIDDIAGLNNLPVFADRPNKFLGFDTSGNPIAIANNTNSGVSTTVSSIATLKNESTVDGKSVFVTGYFNDSDGGGGHYQFDLSSVATDNGGTIVAPNVGSGRWILSATSPVSVKQFGATGDGITDDTAAIQAAVSAGISFFPAGIYITTSIITVSVFPMVFEGPGGRSGDLAPPGNTSAMIHATGSQTAFFEYTATGGEFDNAGSVIKDLVFRSNNSVVDQHVFIFRKRQQALRVQGLSFTDITGYCFAWDPTVSSTGQNISFRDVATFNIGGVVGLTVEPANGANYLACTLLTLDNCSIDGVINSVSPQTFMWDLRAFREIVAHNFLTEGANDASGPDTIVAIGNNAWVLFDGWHNEWTANLPTNYMTVFADPNNRFQFEAETVIEIRNIFTSGSVLKIEDDTEPRVLLKGPSFFTGVAITDFVNIVTPTVLNKAPHVTIEDIDRKEVFPPLETDRGFIDIRSQVSRDLSYVISKGATKIASWRPSDGSLLTFDSAFLDVIIFAPSIASSAIEADTTNPRISVQRITSNVGFASELRFQPQLPTEFFGSLITYVVRYFNEVNVADAGTRFSILSTSDVSAPGQRSFGTETQNAWTTGVLTFNPSIANPNVFSRFIGTTPTVAVITRIAAIDIYLGSAYEEPLALEHPDLLGSTTFDPASIANGAQAGKAFSVPGALVGDFVAVSFSLPLTGLILSGHVSSSGNVIANFYNNTGGAIDLGSGTLSAKVTKK